MSGKRKIDLWDDDNGTHTLLLMDENELEDVESFILAYKKEKKGQQLDVEDLKPKLKDKFKSIEIMDMNCDISIEF